MISSIIRKVPCAIRNSLRRIDDWIVVVASLQPEHSYPTFSPCYLVGLGRPILCSKDGCDGKLAERTIDSSRRVPDGLTQGVRIYTFKVYGRVVVP